MESLTLPMDLAKIKKPTPTAPAVGRWSKETMMMLKPTPTAPAVGRWSKETMMILREATLFCFIMVSILGIFAVLSAIIPEEPRRVMEVANGLLP